MTPYQRHCKKWKKCLRCKLCSSRNKVVLARGIIPAEILFIGEAPGTSENALGRPFVGPAGKLLDRIIEQSIDGQYDYAITNLIACIPLDSEKNKLPEPPKDSILACRPRLAEFVGLVNPKLVVFVGKLATEHARGVENSCRLTKTIHIIHPAAILRMDLSQKGLAVKRSIVTIEDAVDEL